MLHIPSFTSATPRTAARAGLSLVLAATFIWVSTTVVIAAPLVTDRSVAAHAAPRAYIEPHLHYPAASHAPVVAVRPAPTWVIQVDTSGHQPELDQCLWVRMDFTATAPIVGKHNFCGGDFVLDMVWGQTVQLIGQGLDGTYLVTTDRQAFAGESPSGATSGMVANVFLQTCYWDREQGMRLVALVLLPTVPRVVAGAS